MRLGLTLGLEGTPLNEGLGLCRLADELGYTDVWSAEVGGVDALAVLGAAAPSAPNVRLGTAILPVFTRPPALLAMGAATIQSISGGRFVLGLGTSSQIIVEQWMGGSFQRPLARLKDCVEAVREILAGKKVEFEGQTLSLRNFRLQLPIEEPPPIYIAALGPKACRLAGEIADGVIFFLKTAAGVEQALEWVAEGARSAGRDPDQIDCVTRIPVAIDEDEEVLRYMSRRLVTTYAMVDVYNRSLTAQGYGDEMAAVAQAWKAGEREKASEQISDEMLEELNVFGGTDTCRAKLDRFRGAGVKTPVLYPVSVAGDPAERAARVESVVRTLAPRI